MATAAFFRHYFITPGLVPDKKRFSAEAVKEKVTFAAIITATWDSVICAFNGASVEKLLDMEFGEGDVGCA